MYIIKIGLFMAFTTTKILNVFILLCSLVCIKCSNIIHQSTPPAKANSQPQYILADRHTLLMRGHSTSFTDGYMHGCQSGQSAAGDTLSVYTKDEELVKISPDYLVGWQQGNSFCQEHMRNLIKNSGSNNPHIYQSKEAIEQEKQRMWSELRK